MNINMIPVIIIDKFLYLTSLLITNLNDGSVMKTFYVNDFPVQIDLFKCKQSYMEQTTKNTFQQIVKVNIVI